jgi:hypothetical protein
MSASVSATPGGQPSMVAPSAGPWLSPHVVTRNNRPNVLNDMPPPFVPAFSRRAVAASSEFALDDGRGRA